MHKYAKHTVFNSTIPTDIYSTFIDNTKYFNFTLFNTTQIAFYSLHKISATYL